MSNGRVMDNSSFKWLCPVRVVAYLDLVFSSMKLSLVLMLIIVAVFITVRDTAALMNDIFVQKQQEYLGIFKSHSTAADVLMWVAMAIGMAFVLGDFWAAVMLLKATNVGLDAKLALDRAHCWRNVSIVFLFTSVFGGIIGFRNFNGLIYELLLRGTIIFIVSRFINELQAVASRSFPNPSAVVVHDK